MVSQRLEAAACCTLSFFMTACSLDPAAPLISPGISADENSHTAGTLSWLVEEAGRLQDDYSNRYTGQSRFQTFLDIPILGLAIATAGNLLLGGSTTVSAILGASAGGLTAFQLYWNPNAAQDAFKLGATQAGCIFVNGRQLTNYVDDRGQLLDSNGLATVADLLTQTQATVIERGYLTAEAGENNADLASARASLQAAYDASSQALDVVQGQRDAAGQSAGIVQAALSRTQVVVIDATRRQPANFATVQASVVDVLNTAGANQQAILSARRALAGRAAAPSEQADVANARADTISDMNSLAAQLTRNATAVLDRVRTVDVTRLNQNVALCAPTA